MFSEKTKTPFDSVTQFIEYLTKQGIEYIRFELPDLHGTSRSKVVPVDKVASFASKGLNFYGGYLALDTASMVVPGSGYHEERNYRDLVVIPDLDTLTPVAWMEKTAKVICDPMESATEPLGIAPRYILKRLLAEASQLGFDVMMAHEFEFYLLNQETKELLFDGLHAFNNVRNNYVPEISQLINYLRASGIDLINYHCEHAPSQLEINYGASIGIGAADKAFTFKNAVKEIIYRLGYHATFMSKPFINYAGSCSHFHISLIDRNTGNNAFVDKNNKYGLSATAQAFIQGILDHAEAMIPLVSPTPNCYRRFKPQTFAPSNISWGIEDRTAMVRVKVTDEESTHIEMRAASGLSNPYLTAAATLAAGLLGIKQERQLQPLAEGPREEDPNLPKLPQTLEEALSGLAADVEMQNILSQEFVRLFTTVKRFELARFHEHLTEWERHEYLDIY